MHKKIAILAFLALVPPAHALGPAVLQVDYDSVRKDLTGFIREQMDKSGVKGLSVALVDDQQVVWLQGFGKADDRTRMPATGQTLYPVGALSKLFTAVEVLKLADEGKVRLDAPIQKYLPEFSIHSRFKKTGRITVRSLLSQHSGLPGFFIRGLWSDHPDGLDQAVADLKADYMTAPPGTLFKYSYVDYDLLGRLIEVKRGAEFPEAMRADLLDPMGLDSTTFRDTPVLEGKAATGYRDGRQTPFYRTRDIPAAGMFSDAEDMARFVKFLFKSDPDGLKEKSLEAMFTPQYAGRPLDFGLQVGLGWMLSGVEVAGSEGTAWHDGAYPPYFSRIVVLNRQKLGLVLLSNSTEAQKLAKEVTDRALKLMLQAKFGLKADLKKEKIEMPPVVPVPTETLDRYTGSYSAFGQVTKITRDGAKLSAEAAHLKLELIPVAQDTFVPRVVVLFLFPIDLPQFPLVFSNSAGLDTAVLRGLPFPIALERISPAPIPEAWTARLGDYAIENPDDQVRFNAVSLGVRDGFLTVVMKVTFNAFSIKDQEYKVAVLPLSEEDAVVPGLFYGDGGTLHAVEKDGQTRIFYSGYWFKRQIPPVTRPHVTEESFRFISSFDSSAGPHDPIVHLRKHRQDAKQ